MIIPATHIRILGNIESVELIKEKPRPGSVIIHPPRSLNFCISVQIPMTINKTGQVWAERETPDFSDKSKFQRNKNRSAVITFCSYRSCKNLLFVYCYLKRLCFFPKLFIFKKV